MRIDRIVIDGWKGFTFDFDMNPGMNVLIGMNGCGKTTILDLIAGLTGTDTATELLRGSFRFIRLDVSWGVGETKVTETPRKRSVEVVTRHETIMLRDSFETPESVYEIARFKKLLPRRTSYVLRHDLGDIRYLGEITDRETNMRETIRALKYWDMPLQLQVTPDKAYYWLSDTGAQRYILTVGMRFPDAHTPMLVDMPERSLHVVLRRRIHEFYTRWEVRDQQVIYATHCPEMVSSALRDIDLNNWHNQTPDQRPKDRSLYDLHSKDIAVLRKDYATPI